MDAGRRTVLADCPSKLQPAISASHFERATAADLINGIKIEFQGATVLTLDLGISGYFVSCSTEEIAAPKRRKEAVAEGANGEAPVIVAIKLVDASVTIEIIAPRDGAMRGGVGPNVDAGRVINAALAGRFDGETRSVLFARLPCEQTAPLLKRLKSGKSAVS